MLRKSACSRYALGPFGPFGFGPRNTSNTRAFESACFLSVLFQYSVNCAHVTGAGSLAGAVGAVRRLRRVVLVHLHRLRAVYPVHHERREVRRELAHLPRDPPERVRVERFAVENQRRLRELRRALLIPVRFFVRSKVKPRDRVRGSGASPPRSPPPPPRAASPGDIGDAGGVAAFDGDSGGVDNAVALSNACVDDGDSGEPPMVGVEGIVGACSGRPAFASSRRFRT